MKKIITLIAVMLVSNYQSADAQCLPRSSSYGGEVIPYSGDTLVVYSGFMQMGEYLRMPILDGGSYMISTCFSGFDTQITGFKNDIVNTSIFYNDDNGVECTGTSASVAYTSNYSGYLRAMITDYDCITTLGSFISVRTKQYNNLSFTSSTTNMCAGETYNLAAIPLSLASTPTLAGAGDPGTFSGPGVVGNVFTAPTGVTDGLATYTITYTFGYCTTTQVIYVYTYLGPDADAGPDQIDLCGNSTFLAANNTANGTWSIISGAGSITDIYDPTSTISGLTPGTTTLLQWDSEYGACASSDQVNIAIESTPPVPDNATLADINSNCPATPAIPTAVDNCAGNMTATTTTSFPISTLGTSSVIWTFDDGNGNSTTQTQNVTITSLDNSITDNGGSLMANATGVTYQWIDCDNGMTPIMNETNQNFTPTVNGNYAVEVSNGTCSETSSCTFVQVVGIDELSQNQVVIYPNPTNGEITFKTNANIQQIEILDITGKIVVTTSNTTKLDLSKLNKGVYFAKVYFEDSFVQKKITKN